MKNDLKKLKKDELIELVHKLKNERNTEDEEVQKLKNEIQEFKNACRVSWKDSKKYT